MKKKVLVLMLTAGMLTSGLAANTFASDSNEEFTQFAEETESTEGMTAESVDSDLDFVEKRKRRRSQATFFQILKILRQAQKFPMPTHQGRCRSLSRK